MALQDTEADRAFRREVRDWLAENLVGDFAELGSRGGPGREHEGFEVRQAWERTLGTAGWTCLGWPKEHGGREATLEQQVAFHEEYARAGAPARLGHIGEGLIGPTIIEFGTDAQKARFLPPIRSGDELWCQGYSEPDAGSDLANVKTRAERDGELPRETRPGGIDKTSTSSSDIDAQFDSTGSSSAGEWVITGQKVWTSLATWADWVFVLCRTDPSAPKHKGLSYILVPMDQPGIEVRPIVQLTGTSEFNEVFFDGARTDATNIVGDVNDGWRVAMGTLAYERGVATLGQQVGFERELTNVIVAAQKNGANHDPVMRQRLADAWIGLKLLRYNALRSLASIADGAAGPEASISKLHWATWHRALGELALDVQGAHALLANQETSPRWRESADCPDLSAQNSILERFSAPYDLTDEQRLFLFTRADTIYGGSNQIQRNIIGERALGLPRA